MLITPEVHVGNPEEHHNDKNDPPSQVEARVPEDMEADTNPASNPNPPSPKPSSPAKSSDKSPAADNVDDIALTRSSFKAPEVS